jgi:hypothetical protein
MTRPIISIVTGTYNRFEMLQNFVQSVRNQLPDTFPYEFVICDGGSTDGTLPWLREQFDVVLIEDGELKGAISAFTRAAKRAQGDYVILANDDVVMGEDSILTAYVYLQENMRCGAVAFKDNRPIPGYVDDTTYKTLKMPAVKDGRAAMVIYAQVGMFRRWLGEHIGWWQGVNNEMTAARIYAGDNFLSAKIWEYGYTVEEVPGCYVIDYVADDELRQINRDNQKVSTVNDSHVYYSLWGKSGGPNIPPAPTLQQQDTPTIRVLYLPIYEPGWAVQKQQKRGLRDALLRARTPKGWGISVYELDYMAIPPDRLEAELLHAAEVFQPRLTLTQIQGHLPITAEMLSKLRSLHPRASIINWNGDQAEGGLIAPEMIKVLRQVDLQLVVNASALETYEKHGIPAAYWQIGFEEPQGALPEMPAHDVVFLGSFNNPKRLPLKAALEKLRDEQVNVGIYQPGDLSATLYDFAKGKALYNQAKIAVGSNEYPDSKGFVSNRLFQAIAAGGCLYFQQKVEALDSLTGLQANTHFVEWDNFATLRAKVLYYLDPLHITERRAIADAGTAFVREHHSFDARVQELFALIKQHINLQQPIEGNSVYIRYVGPRTDAFGAGKSHVNERIKYDYIPGKLLLVDRLDAPYFLSQPNLWVLAQES